MNEEEKATRENEEKEEIITSLEFKIIDVLEAKLVKKFRKVTDGEYCWIS